MKCLAKKCAVDESFFYLWKTWYLWWVELRFMWFPSIFICRQAIIDSRILDSSIFILKMQSYLHSLPLQLHAFSFTLKMWFERVNGPEALVSKKLMASSTLKYHHKNSCCGCCCCCCEVSEGKYKGTQHKLRVYLLDHKLFSTFECDLAKKNVHWISLCHQRISICENETVVCARRSS